MRRERIGIVGLGTMGRPMAANLLAAGYAVCIHQRKSAQLESLLAAGAVAKVSIQEVMKASDILILMLPDDKAVLEVIAGEEGIAKVAASDQIVIDSSTIHPDTSRQCSRLLLMRGTRHLDAPVTGSRPQAEGKQLGFLVGGDRTAFDSCGEVFAAMGKGHTYLGPSGAGTSTKLAANFMNAVHLLALKEALAMVRHTGVDPQKFLDVVSNSGARSAVADVKGPKILREDWSPDFALKLMLKDMSLARSLGSGGPEADRNLLDCVMNAYGRAVERWGGDGDVCAVARNIERNDK